MRSLDAWPVVGPAWSLVKEAIRRWISDGAIEMSAAMAFYAAFSMAPTLLILIWLVGSVYGEETPLQIQGQIETYIGPGAAEVIAEVVTATRSQVGAGLAPRVLAIFTMILGASWVFAQLLSALNRVWHVRPKPGRGILGVLRDRFWPFIIVGVGSALILSSLVLGALIHATSAYVNRFVPGAEFVWHYVDLGLSFAVITVLFALLYKFLPDARIAWSDVWIGALVTAALFSLGKYAFSFYLGTTAIASVYGAAGSFLLVLVWVYFSTSILLLGAEFTHIYAERHGHRVIPKRHAVAID